MQKGLTVVQKRLLDVIHDYIHEYGYPPSYREMAHRAGIYSTGRVNKLIRSLEERGHIQRIPGRARSICLVTEDVVRIGDQLVDENNNYYIYDGRGNITRVKIGH